MGDHLTEFGNKPPRSEDESRLRVLRKRLRSVTEERAPCAGEEEKPKPTQFAQYGIISEGIYSPNPQTKRKLPPGIYEFLDAQNGFFFKLKTIEADDLLVLPDNRTTQLTDEINTFWEKKDAFVKYGFLHRRGVLLYGPAGSGKSLLLQQISRSIVEEGDVVFICSEAPKTFQMGLEYFRQIEPNRRCVCIFEDIDALIDAWGEEDLLMLLDGENVIDSCLSLATTNYPEKLDKRIVARPRRFDRVIKIDMPSESVRRFYLQEKLRISDDKEDIDKWVAATDGFSFAALAELVISVRCLNKNFDDALKTIRDLTVAKPSSEEFEKSQLGFKVGD